MVKTVDTAPWEFHELSRHEVIALPFRDDPAQPKGTDEVFFAYTRHLEAQGLELSWPVDGDVLPDVYWNARPVVAFESFTMSDGTEVPAGTQCSVLLRLDVALPTETVGVFQP